MLLLIRKKENEKRKTEEIAHGFHGPKALTESISDDPFLPSTAICWDTNSLKWGNLNILQSMVLKRKII